MDTIITELIQKARKAQDQINYWSQEKVDLMVAAAGWETYKPENAEKIAALAIEETGMGSYEHKFLKHQVKTIGVLRDLKNIKSVVKKENRVFKFHPKSLNNLIKAPTKKRYPPIRKSIIEV